MIELALYRPEMPGNAGNIMRLSVNVGAPLHLIGPLPFFLDDKRLIRAGLDYRERSCFTLHPDYEHFQQTISGRRLLIASSKASCNLYDFAFQEQDVVLFGREKEGLPKSLTQGIDPALHLRIPMAAPSRCLNLSNAVAVVAYEAFRQLGYARAQTPEPCRALSEPSPD